MWTSSLGRLHLAAGAAGRLSSSTTSCYRCCGFFFNFSFSSCSFLLPLLLYLFLHFIPFLLLLQHPPPLLLLLLLPPFLLLLLLLLLRLLLFLLFHCLLILLFLILFHLLLLLLFPSSCLKTPTIKSFQGQKTPSSILTNRWCSYHEFTVGSGLHQSLTTVQGPSEEELC